MRELKKELEQLEKHQIVHHVLEVYKRYPRVKDYFDFFLNPDEEVLLDDYKVRVHEGFYPSRGKKLKLYRSRRAINEFKKLAVSEEAIAELLLYFTQVAVMYGRETKVSAPSFYERIEKSLRAALEFMEKYELLDSFRGDVMDLVERCEPFPLHCGQHVRTIVGMFYNQTSAV